MVYIYADRQIYKTDIHICKTFKNSRINEYAHAKVNFQCMCTGCIKCPQNTLICWILTLCDVTNHARGKPLKKRFSISTEKLYTSSNECENSLQMSDSAHISSYTVKCKYSTVRARRKACFWLEGGLKWVQKMRHKTIPTQNNKFEVTVA